MHKIHDLNELARVQSHGRRLDPSSQARVDPTLTSNNFYSSPYAQCPSDLVGAWNVAVDLQGARTYGLAPIGLHVIAVITPAWIREAGDLQRRETELASVQKAFVHTTELFRDGALKVRWSDEHRRSVLYVAEHVQGDERTRARENAKIADRYGLARVLVELADDASATSDRLNLMRR